MGTPLFGINEEVYVRNCNNPDPWCKPKAGIVKAILINEKETLYHIKVFNSVNDEYGTTVEYTEEEVFDTQFCYANNLFEQIENKMKDLEESRQSILKWAEE